jgi:hypothetical protein
MSVTSYTTPGQDSGAEGRGAHGHDVSPAPPPTASPKPMVLQVTALISAVASAVAAGLGLTKTLIDVLRSRCG